MDDELVLVSSVSNSLAESDRVQPSEIDNREFIIREEGSGTRELFESVRASHGINWKVAGVYNNAEAIKNAVSAGLAISVMSRMAVQKEVSRNELAIVQIERINFQRQFVIAYHKNQYISPALHQFIRVCIEYGISKAEANRNIG